MTAIIVRLDRFLLPEVTKTETVPASSHTLKRPLTEESSADGAQLESEGNLD